MACGPSKDFEDYEGHPRRQRERGTHELVMLNYDQNPSRKPRCTEG